MLWLGCFAIIAIVCLLSVLQFVRAPFPGFFFSERMKVDFRGPSHWTGTQAGLQYPDKIILVNGKPMNATALQALALKVPIGSSIRYTVEQKGEKRDVLVPTMLFTWQDFMVKFFILFVIGIVYVLLGFIVFYLKPNSEVGMVFLCSGLFLGTDYVTTSDLSFTHLGFTRLLLFSECTLAANLIHLSFIFPERINFIEKFKWITWIPYLLSMILALGLIWSYPDQALFDNLFIFLNQYLGIGAGIFLLGILRTFFLSQSLLGRARAKVILFGAALAFPIPAIAPVLSSYGQSLAEMPTVLTAVPLTLFPFSIAYAIAKHNLFDLDVYIKRTLGYIIMTVLVGGGYLEVAPTF